MTTPVGPDFIALQVRSLATSSKFYMEVFGFEAAAQSPRLPTVPSVASSLPVIPMATRSPFIRRGADHSPRLPTRLSGRLLLTLVRGGRIHRGRSEAVAAQGGRNGPTPANWFGCPCMAIKDQSQVWDCRLLLEGSPLKPGDTRRVEVATDRKEMR
jgi:hypothetical protein